MKPDRLRVADGRRVENEEKERLRRLLDAEVLPRLERPGRYVGITSRSRFDRPPARSALHLLWPSPAEGPLIPAPLAALRQSLLAHGIGPTFSCSPTPELARAMLRHGFGPFTHDSWAPLHSRPVWLVWFEEPAQILGLLSTLECVGAPLRRADRGANGPCILAAGPGCASRFPLLESCVDQVLRETDPTRCVDFCRVACEGVAASAMNWAPPTQTSVASAEGGRSASVHCVTSDAPSEVWRLRSRDRDALPATRLLLLAASSQLRRRLGLRADVEFAAAIERALAEGQLEIVLAVGHGEETDADRVAIGSLAGELAAQAGERRRRIRFELTAWRDSTATESQLDAWLAAAEAAVRQTSLAVRRVSLGEVARERGLLAASGDAFEWLETIHRSGCYAAESELARDPKAWDNCARTGWVSPPVPALIAEHVPTGLRANVPGRLPVEQATRPGATADRWRPWRASVPQYFDYRFEFAKRGRLRHLSQRELGELLLNACHQAGLEVATAGVAQPKPKISFGPPLGAGVTGLREIVDLSLTHKHPDPIAAILDRLPRGFTLRQVRFVPGGIGRNGLDRIDRAEYAVNLPAALLERVGIEPIAERVAELSQLIAVRSTSGSDPIQQVHGLELAGARAHGEAMLRFALELRGDGKRLRPRDLLERLLGDIEPDLNILRLRRTRLWAQASGTGELVTPLELIDRHVNRLRANAKLCA